MLIKEKKYLKSNWFLVGSKNEILNKNDFKTIEIFNEPILIYNTGREIKSFLNVCPHRGSKIKIKKSGNELFRCDYHGWCFDNNGKFLSAPYESSFNHLNKNLKLSIWKTEIFGDLIFIASPRVKVSLKTYLSFFNKKLSTLTSDIGQLVHQDEYIWNCNWKIAIENSIDEYHAPFLHRSTFKKVLKMMPQYLFSKKILYMDMPLNKEYLESIKNIKNLIKNKNNNYSHILFFPFTTFASTMGIFNFVQVYSPLNEKQTRILTSIFINKKNLKKNLSKLLIESAVKFNNIVFNQDRQINENLKHNFKNNNNFFYSDYEQRVIKFRDIIKNDS